MSEQRVKAVNFVFCKKPPKLIGYHSNVPWDTAKHLSFIIPIHISTNAENVVKIGPVVVEIFGGICRFLPSRPKRWSCYPHNLWAYWTDLHQTCTWGSYNIAIRYFWIESAIFYPFRNASLPNKDHFANFSQIWLPWQRPLTNPKRALDRSFTNKYTDYFSLPANSVFFRQHYSIAIMRKSIQTSCYVASVITR